MQVSYLVNSQRSELTEQTVQSPEPLMPSLRIDREDLCIGQVSKKRGKERSGEYRLA